jgi:hypothetical protein
MNTSIVKEKLSDGSIAYNLVMVDGSTRVVIACVDKIHARELQQAFLDHACYMTIQ